MQKILFCIDTDVERAKQQVKALTELPLDVSRTQILIYHVFRGDGEGLEAENLKSVSYSIDALKQKGFEVEIDQSNGEVVRNILSKAKEAEVDVICMAGRKRSPTGKALFGSVTQEIALESDLPVVMSTTN